MIVACPFCGDPSPTELSPAEKAVNRAVYCARCGMSWRGPRCDERHETVSPITHAAMFATFAGIVKRLRRRVHEQKIRCGYPKDSPEAILLDGQALGMNAVLELVCNNPLED